MTSAASADLTENTRRRKHPYLRWFGVLVATLLAAVAALDVSNRRNERAIDLIHDLRASGGTVDLPPTLLNNLRNVWASGTGAWRSHTGVVLRGEIDSDWVRRHDYLADLNVTRLEVYGDNVNNVTLQRMFEVHQINLLGAFGRHDTDALAPLLASDGELTKMYLNNSDLTDVGFRQLPLEQLEELAIDQTKVTAEGVDELRRCTPLRKLEMNWSQISDTLARLPALERLYVRGPAMTDETLTRLQGCQNLQILLLKSTSTPSQKAIEALNAALPECDIQLRFPLPP